MMLVVPRGVQLRYCSSWTQLDLSVELAGMYAVGALYSSNCSSSTYSKIVNFQVCANVIEWFRAERPCHKETDKKVPLLTVVIYSVKLNIPLTREELKMELVKYCLR